MEPTIIGAIINGFATLFSKIIDFKNRKNTALIIIVFTAICVVFLIPGFIRHGPDSTPTPAPTPVPTPAPTSVPTDTSTSKYPNPPSDELLDIYGPRIHYPDKTEYLSECEIKYIDAPKGYSVYAYSSHRKDKELLYEVRDGEEVTVLAENKNNGFSCVIIESLGKAAWINTARIFDTPA